MEKNVGMEILKELREINNELKTISANTSMMEDFDLEDIETEIAIEKGDAFENYVVDHFDKQYFSIVFWSGDHCRKRNIRVESDTYPDLVIRYNRSNKNETFAVECKYRKNHYKGKLNWSKYGQIERYTDFQELTQIPVFVVIGLGGEPDKPDRMFCIPLNDIDYVGLYPSVYEKYERKPDEMFFWKDSILS
jgi:hypothetical protein